MQTEPKRYSISLGRHTARRVTQGSWVCAETTHREESTGLRFPLRTLLSYAARGSRSRIRPQVYRSAFCLGDDPPGWSPVTAAAIKRPVLTTPLNL
jgi:hypothetical protein